MSNDPLRTNESSPSTTDSRVWFFIRFPDRFRPSFRARNKFNNFNVRFRLTYGDILRFRVVLVVNTGDLQRLRLIWLDTGPLFLEFDFGRSISTKIHSFYSRSESENEQNGQNLISRNLPW